MVNRRVLAFALLAASGARGQTPASESARADFAKLAGAEVAQVKELSLIRFTHAPGVSGALLGRYQDKGFPALAVYHRCPLGNCLTLVSLGSAADRVEALRLIDLDAPSTTLEALDSIGFGAEPVEPPRDARWPALAVLVERLRGDEREVELVLVSLREPRPTRLWSVATLRRRAKEWPPPPEGPPPTVPVGERVHSLTFEHHGAEHTIVEIDILIESGSNPCLPPKPGETRLRLDGEFYKQVSMRPSTVCH